MATEKGSMDKNHKLNVAKIEYMMEDLCINVPKFQTIERFYRELAFVDVSWVNPQMYDAAAGIFAAIVFAAPLYECSDPNDNDSLINCFWETMPSYSDEFKERLVKEDLVGTLRILQNKNEHDIGELYRASNALVDLIWAIYFERCPRVKDIPYVSIIGQLYFESFVDCFNLGEKVWRQVFSEVDWPAV